MTVLCTELGWQPTAVGGDNMLEVSKSFWEEEKEVSKPVVNVTGKSAIRTKVTAKNGKEYVDLRKYVNIKGKDTGFGQFTSDGLSIEVSMLDAVISALAKAKSELVKRETKKAVKVGR